MPRGRAKAKPPDETPAKVVQPVNVKIKGTIGKALAEFNGLITVADEMGKKPMQRYPVVGIVERHSRTEQDGTTTVTARFIHIEPLDGETALVVQSLLDDAYTARTGANARQMDLFEGGADPVDPANPQDQQAMMDGPPTGDDPPWDEGPPAAEDGHPPAAVFSEPDESTEDTSTEPPDETAPKRAKR